MFPQLEFHFFPQEIINRWGEREDCFKIMTLSKEKKQFHSYNSKNH